MNRATLNVGIIGCGRVAQMRHLPALKKLSGVRIVACADRDTQTLSRISNQYAVAHQYTDHQALLDNAAVDAVLVCTPPGDHSEHARDVLLSGRHLYVDAPLALSIEQCDDLVRLAARTDCVATVGLNLRHHSLIERARKCIRSGVLGPVQALTATFSTPSRGRRGDKFPAWRQPDTVDGSVFGESALQHFDAWRALTGADFSEVAVQCPEIGGPVSIAANMLGRGEAQGQSIVVGAIFSEYSGDNSEIRLIGRNGTIALSLYRYDGFSYCPALVAQGSARQHARAVAESIRSLPQGVANLIRGGEYGITFQRQLERFVAACRNKTPALVSVTDGRAATVAALAAFESMTTGQKVSIPAA